MPVFIVTAVTAGTDTLTAAGHDLLTGDRFRLRNIGGALPTATPALAAVTDYFAIRVDANSIKVAVSSADALAGTAVNITGAGSGTTTIEYGLPFCVPRIAARLTRVEPEDDNAAWNALVALYGLLTGQPQSIWTVVTLALALTISGALSVGGQLAVGGQITATGGIAAFTANGLITAAAGVTAAVNQHFTVSGTGLYKHGTRTITIAPPGMKATEGSLTPSQIQRGFFEVAAVANACVSVPILLPVGSRVTGFRARTNSATNPINGLISSVDDNGGVVTLMTTADAPVGGTHTITGVGSVTIAPGVAYEIVIRRGSGSGLFTCFKIEYDYDQP